MDKIKLTAEDGEVIEVYVIETTKVNGVDYYLVTETDDDDEDEAAAYIIKEVSADADGNASYEFVDDDDEIDAVARIFSELLEDTDLI